MSTTAATSSAATPPSNNRIRSVDALRGLVMFTMIYVNDLAGAPESIVPAWMRHFHGQSGMTFVDLVFPAFLFIVGLSIPFALGSRLAKGEPLGKTILHIVTRTLALLFIGVMMVNESPNSAAMGWSAQLWSALMFLAAMLAFGTYAPRLTVPSNPARLRVWRLASRSWRILGFAALVFLAFAFRGENGRRIVTLSPFSIHTEWYGILGLIGWAYLVASVLFLSFRCQRTALLGGTVLLLCLYVAEKHGVFRDFWLSQYVGVGGTLGSQASITVAGMLLGSILHTPDTSTVAARTRFTLLFIAGFSAGAWLLNGLYGINKNSATPSWCLWACAITATLWLLFYYLCDIRRVEVIAQPLAVAGQNVLLAYLLSEMLPSVLELLHLDGWYDHLASANLVCAVTRSAGCAVLILGLTAGLNRFGFRLKL